MFKLLLIPILSLTMMNTSLFVRESVDVSTLNANEMWGGWGHNTSFTEDGLLALSPGHDTVGDNAWQYKTVLPGVGVRTNSTNYTQNFSLNNNETISFEFSLNMFDTSGNDNVIGTHTDANNPNDIYFLDIYVHDRTNDAQLALLRIFTESGSKLNGNHSSALYGSGWDQQLSSSYWLMGDATLDSSFYIQFDKDNLFSSYAGGQEGIVPLFDLNSDLAKTIKNNLANVDEIIFKIAPNNGWNKEASLYLKSINGQKLNSVDGAISDNVAPTFNAISLPSSLSINNPQTLEISAHDVLSEVRYEIEYNGVRNEGLTFTPNKVGADSVLVYALDSSNNESSYLYNFEGINVIPAPTFTSLPVINDAKYNYYDNIVIDAPSIEDVTGVAVITLSYGLTSEGTRNTLNMDINRQFVINIDKEFVFGEYEFVFLATNSGGTSTSDPIIVNISLADINLVDFIDVGEADIILDYVDYGLRAKTRTNYQYLTLGRVDLADEQSLTFVIPFSLSDGSSNNIQCFEWQLVNINDPQYYISYRMWTDQTSTNFDAPTNVLISTPSGVNDITNCGWRSYGQNPAYREVTFVFDPNSSAYFHSYDNSNVLVPALGVDNAMAAFFNEAPSSYYEARVCGMNTSLGDGPLSTTFEYGVVSFSGQNYRNTNGVIDNINDPIVKLSGPSECEVNQTVNINYFYDDYTALDEDLEVSLNVTNPQGEKIAQELSPIGLLTLTTTEMGTYLVELDVKGASGNTIHRELSINVKQESNPIEITLNGEYPTSLNVGDSITILGATYSAHANMDKSTITIIDMNNGEINVNVGDTFTFTIPGLYTIRYFASDDALPENNTATLDIRINVLDVTKPVVTTDLLDTYNLGEEVTITIIATDETELSYRVIITSPSGTRKEYTSNVITLTFNEIGEYSIHITVTDLYDNVTPVDDTFNVIDDRIAPIDPPSANDDNAGLIIGLSVAGGVILLGGAAALVIVLIKKKKGK